MQRLIILSFPDAPEVIGSMKLSVSPFDKRKLDRAGLRYQRRGIDDDANVANFVETEAIMRVKVGTFISFHFFIFIHRTPLVREKCRITFFPTSKYEDPVSASFPSSLAYLIAIFPLVPLFWTQSGYSMKPPPTLNPDRDYEQHSNALKRHFAKTISRYGPHVGLNTRSMVFF
jgi:phosphatidylinositol 4-phosphatase